MPQPPARIAPKVWIDPKDRHPLHEDPRYWQARKCGWDALSDELSRDETGRPADAEDSAFWLWWATLHYESRQQLVLLSRELPGEAKTDWVQEDQRTQLLEKFAPIHDPAQWARRDVA